MKSLFTCIALALAATAHAQTLGEQLEPHFRKEWRETAPTAGGTRMLLRVRGKSFVVYRVAPGESVEVPLEGPGGRLLVHTRPVFGARGEAAVDYAWTWKVDGGPETRVAFRAGPHAEASFEGDPAVPGARDRKAMYVSEDGPHVVRFGVPADGNSPVVFRFYVEMFLAPSEKRRTGQVHSETWWMQTRTRLSIVYDDNLFRLDDEDVHARGEQDSSHPYDKFDKMESNEDWGFLSECDVDMVGPKGPLGRFAFGISLSQDLWWKNHVRNDWSAEFRLKYQPTADLRVTAWANWRPDHFVGTFDTYDTASRLRAHAHYDRSELGARLWKRFTPDLTATLSYEHEFRDYNSSFNERDSRRDHFETGVRWEPSPWLKTDFEVRYTHARALATGDEPDRSFRAWSPRLEIEVDTGHVFFSLAYRYESRTYTTSNDGAVDPFHAGRRDRFHAWTATAGLDISKESRISLSWTRLRHTSRINDRQSADDAFDLDDEVEYDASRFELAYEFSFP